MLVSILHRVTGVGLAVLGSLTLAWWLVAAARGEAAYNDFIACVTSPFGKFVAFGLTWAMFQHTLSGVRHFVMDIGAGYELNTNKFWATMTVIGSIVLTALLWIWLLGVRT